MRHSDGKTILLTGAAGRVGTLLRPLLRSTFILRLCDIARVTADEGEQVFQGDLGDAKFAREAVAGTTGVVHLAGLVASRVSFEDTLNGNYRALLAVLDACRAEDVRRFVYASSHHVLGLKPADRMYDERATPAPDGFYGLSKAFGEAACTLYALRFGIATLAIRIGNADPQVVDGRRERIWVSGRDLAQLVTLGLTVPNLRYEVVYGVSNCPRPMFRNDAAARLGYRPQDTPAEHRAHDFQPLPEGGTTDATGHVGGRFVADPLPDPLAGTR